MSKQKWSFKTHTSALADTGDYEYYVQFTNGEDVLQTSGDELEEEQMQQFCDLLNCMPDLWSHKCDYVEFENSQLKQQIKHSELNKNLQKIKAVQDESSHWYIIPDELSYEFYKDEQNESMIDSGEFDKKYGKYMTGGSLNLIQLWGEID